MIEFGLIDDWTPEANILSQALLLSLGEKELGQNIKDCFSVRAGAQTNLGSWRMRGSLNATWFQEDEKVH